jgi:hypothetical protein
VQPGEDFPNDEEEEKDKRGGERGEMGRKGGMKAFSC